MGIYIEGIEMPKDDGRLSIDIFPNGKVCINLDLECNQIATATSIPASALRDTISKQAAIDAFDGVKTPKEYCPDR